MPAPAEPLQLTAAARGLGTVVVVADVVVDVVDVAATVVVVDVVLVVAAAVVVDTGGAGTVVVEVALIGLVVVCGFGFGTWHDAAFSSAWSRACCA